MTKMSVNPNKIYESISLPVESKNWFDKTHPVTFTCKPGELTPCLVMPVTPGNDVELDCTMVITMPALVVNAYVRATAYVHYFYVSNRVVWPSFDEWFQGDSGYTIPILEVNAGVTAPQIRHLDNFGIPPQGPGAGNALALNAFSFAAGLKIYNDYYRPRPFENPIAFECPAVGGDVGATLRTNYLTTRLRSYMHDYHTSMLPEPLVAPEVTVGIDIALKANWQTFGTPFWAAAGSGVPIHDGHVLQSAGVNKVDTAGVPPVDIAAWDPDGSLEGSTTVNKLREAYARARYLEKMGRSGGEYYEIVMALYNERISDARLQRAEYITGIQAPVIINPVLSTSDGTGATLARKAGNAIVAGSSERKKTFHVEEHGYILAYFSLIPYPVYSQGVERHFRAFDREDFLIPDLANIGEQPVLSSEITAYVEAQDAQTTIGYLPNYTDWKQKQARIAGEFRTSLAAYVVVKEYDISGGVPTLDKDFVQVQPDCMDHIFEFDAGVTDPLWVNMLHGISHRLPLPVYSDPV